MKATRNCIAHNTSFILSNDMCSQSSEFCILEQDLGILGMWQTYFKVLKTWKSLCLAAYYVN